MMRIVDQNKLIKKNLYALEKRLGRGKIFYAWFSGKSKDKK